MSSLPYSLDKMNYFIHLTNNAVQVKSNSYGSYVKGNIIGLSVYLNSLKASPEDDVLAKLGLPDSHFMDQIKSLVTVSFDCCKGLLNPNKREKCFEIYGFDFMIDENMKVWLIEVNSVASLGESNEFNTRFFSRLLDDTFKITLDRIYPPTKEQEAYSHKLPKYPLDNFSDDQNLWTLVAKY